jgi:hypothetical protein
MRCKENYSPTKIINISQGLFAIKMLVKHNDDKHLLFLYLLKSGYILSDGKCQGVSKNLQLFAACRMLAACLPRAVAICGSLVIFPVIYISVICVILLSMR